jgi:hypothetical protein
MNDLDLTLQRFVDRAAAEIAVPAVGDRRAGRRLRLRPGVLVLMSAVVILVLGSTAAVAQNWFTEIFRIGNVSAAASRPVSLAEARTTGLPLPPSGELPGGWTLRDERAVGLTRTPEWTMVGLQYDRAGRRGMNITVASGLRLFDPRRVEYDEILTVTGATVYVSRQHEGGFPTVRAMFTLTDVQVEIWAFGPALAERSLTSEEISEFVRIWMGASRHP